VQNLLEADATLIVWDQDVFRLSKPTIESLADISARVDAAIFIFAPDDKLRIRGKKLETARDNVVYELGLFSGRLEPRRCFIITPRSTKLRIPSDLLGLTFATYDPAEGNHLTALGAATNQIRSTLKGLGRFSSEEAVLARDENSPSAGLDARAIDGFWLSRFEFRTGRTGRAGYQYNLERLEARGSRTLAGGNLAAMSSNGRNYEHSLKLTVMKSHLTGLWFNTNHESVGVCQFRVHSNRNVLEGFHLGDADDESVQSGVWNWVRLKPDTARPLADVRPGDAQLRPAGDLDVLFRRAFDDGVAIPAKSALDTKKRSRK
jgi:hypothetical protein